MDKPNKYLAVVPARGGSKRLARKNVLELAGKPLISWTIEAAIASQNIAKVLVSSDDPEILNIAAHANVTALERPADLASDTASSIDVVKHAVEYSPCEYVVLLQPTSPLRTPQHIDDAIHLLEQKKADAVISVCETEHNPLWANTLPDSLSMEGFLKNELLNKRSQELPPHYRLNGAIYICKTDALLENNTFFLKKNIYAYKMSARDSVDIDTKFDFKIASFLIGENRRK